MRVFHAPSSLGLLLKVTSTLRLRRSFSSCQYSSPAFNCLPPIAIDRKSTRLNSSHVSISYAVFCLKKKNFHSDTKIRRGARAPSLVRRHTMRPVEPRFDFDAGQNTRITLEVRSARHKAHRRRPRTG